jgi:hypothetical protein
MNPPLVLIGYWRSDDEPQWPDVRDFVDPDWSADERELIIEHLRRGKVARAYLGKSRCRLCGVDAGSLELRDGVFIWPEGLVHYVVDHHVRLPRRFVEHIGAMTEALEDAEIDSDWWAGQDADGASN